MVEMKAIAILKVNERLTTASHFIILVGLNFRAELCRSRNDIDKSQCDFQYMKIFRKTFLPVYKYLVFFSGGTSLFFV